MSAVSIFENLFQFYHVLISAASDEVIEWNGSSVQNALNWADYIVELSRHIKVHGNTEDVNRHLQQMTVLIQPASCLCLNVDKLERAKAILVETLLSNTKLPVKSKKQLISCLQADREGITLFEEVSSVLERSQLHMEELISLFTAVKRFVPTTDSSIELLEHKCQCQARSLMEHLILTRGQIKDLERFEIYCHALCDRLSETQEGQNVIVFFLCLTKSDFPLDQETWINLIQSHFLVWVQHKLNDMADSYCFVISAPVKALIQASCVNDQFVQVYVRALSLWADSFSPHIDEEGTLVWRSELGHSTDELCLHFQRLLDSSMQFSQKSKSFVLKMITDKVKGTDFTVWQELARNLLRLLKKG